MSSTHDFCVDVSPSSDKSKLVRDAVQQITNAYLAEFNVEVEPSEYLTIAHANTQVLGVLGINTETAAKPLRLPLLYEFAESVLEDYPPESSVEFTRWVTFSSGISLPLMLKAVRFSLKIDKKFGWCEHSVIVNRTARRFGVKFHKVQDARLRENLVEEKYLNYYQKENPQLFVLLLKQAGDALANFGI